MEGVRSNSNTARNDFERVHGGEFLVNTTTTGDQCLSINQSKRTVDMDNNGNFVIVWESTSQDGDNGGIYAKRFNAAVETQ